MKPGSNTDDSITGTIYSCLSASLLQGDESGLRVLAILALHSGKLAYPRGLLVFHFLDSKCLTS